MKNFCLFLQKRVKKFIFLEKLPFFTKVLIEGGYKMQNIARRISKVLVQFYCNANYNYFAKSKNN